MLDLFLKLIDKCIQLIKVRKEQDKSLYADFVSPLYSEFTTLHEQYLRQFSEYAEAINAQAESEEGLNQLIDRLYQDNLYTAHQRKKLETLCQLLDSEKGYDEIITFLSAIRYYITTRSLVSHNDGDHIMRLANFVTQGWRNSLKDSLKEIVSESEKYLGQWKDKASHALQELVLELQQAEHGVTSSFLSLKSKLLCP